jgi:hypothetical protein
VDTYSLKHASTAYLSSFFRWPQFMTGLSNAMKQEFERANAAKLVTNRDGGIFHLQVTIEEIGSHPEASGKL